MNGAQVLLSLRARGSDRGEPGAFAAKPNNVAEPNARRRMGDRKRIEDRLRLLAKRALVVREDHQANLRRVRDERASIGDTAPTEFGEIGRAKARGGFAHGRQRRTTGTEERDRPDPQERPCDDLGPATSAACLRPVCPVSSSEPSHR